MVRFLLGKRVECILMDYISRRRGSLCLFGVDVDGKKLIKFRDIQIFFGIFEGEEIYKLKEKRERYYKYKILFLKGIKR